MEQRRRIKTIASQHARAASISQVCLRPMCWTAAAPARRALVHADPAKVGYAAENLDIYGFALTADEMDKPT